VSTCQLGCTPNTFTSPHLLIFRAVSVPGAWSGLLSAGCTSSCREVREPEDHRHILLPYAAICFYCSVTTFDPNNYPIKLVPKALHTSRWCPSAEHVFCSDVLCTVQVTWNSKKIPKGFDWRDFYVRAGLNISRFHLKSDVPNAGRYDIAEMSQQLELELN
jgi:hypothetical protein